MEEPQGVPPPNYTQIPNAILDAMAEMNNQELRVALAIARKTFGWHKKRELLSLTQLELITGLSRQGVINGIEAGMQRGVIKRHKSGTSFVYRLVVNDVDQSSAASQRGGPDLVNDVDQTSQRGGPDLVNDVDTQKKEKKEERKKETEVGASAAPVSSPPVIKDPNQHHPACQLYYELTGYRPNKVSASLIAAKVTDLELWRAVVERWLTAIGTFRNVEGMLDWYQQGVPNATRRYAPRNQRRDSSGADRAPSRPFDLDHDI